MRLFSYMTRIYHISDLMSRQIFVAPGDKKLLESSY